MNKNIILFALASVMLFACDDAIKIKTVQKEKNRNTVSVSGTGEVYAQPDIVRMNINFSHTAKTTSEAKSAVEKTMNKVIATLKDNNIEDKDIKTISLSFDVESIYRKGRYVKIGQRAQQTIVVKINNIIKDPERFPLLIDKITNIDDEVEIRNIEFDIEKKEALFKQSRELAYQKAFEKAKQYAELSEQSIGKAVEISERTSEDVGMANFLNTRSYSEAAYSIMDQSYSIPTGEQKVTSLVNVTFLLE